MNFYARGSLTTFSLHSLQFDSPFASTSNFSNFFRASLSLYSFIYDEALLVSSNFSSNFVFHPLISILIFPSFIVLHELQFLKTIDFFNSLEVCWSINELLPPVGLHLHQSLIQNIICGSIQQLVLVPLLSHFPNQTFSFENNYSLANRSWANISQAPLVFESSLPR